jgi:2-keto-4-pentenoate hydratase/2-oxohepta-3-ene-1,7-dioic acid hydratase in catechol pathway
MRLVTFRDRHTPEVPHLGALVDEGKNVIDLASAHLAMDGTVPVAMGSMQAWLDGGAQARERAQAVIEWVENTHPPRVTQPLEHVSLMSPLMRPRSIRDSMGFERHVIGCMRAMLRSKAPLLASADAWMEKALGRGWMQPSAVWRQHPVYYKGNRFSVVGPNAEIRWPSYTERLDYELEIAAVIGQAGRSIAASRARGHIAGYLIFNDFSARDVQQDEMASGLGPAKAKDFDTGNALGPCLVTPDEIPNVYALAMSASVNGQVWSRGNTADMRWRFEDLLAWVSRDETLHPGEVFGSGAVGGGCGWELDRWLAPGDVVELSVDRLGILRNRIGTRSTYKGQA